MSNNICFSVFILACLILTFVNSQDDTQEYAIHKDVFSGFKASEYTVYDRSEKHIRYRIESDYGLTHKIKLIAYPSKQEVGRLQAKMRLTVYNANITTFDPKTYLWDRGSIEQIFKFAGSLFYINWRDRRIKGETKPFSLTTNFYNEYGQLLAQVQKRRRIAFKDKYDLKIYSSKYPDQIFLLGLAAHGNFNAAKGRR